MARIKLKASDIQKLNGVKRTQAYKLLQHLKDVYGKKFVTIYDYAEFYDIDIHIIKKELGMM